MKFNVMGNVTYGFAIVVDADSKDEAEEIVQDRIGDGMEVGYYDTPTIDIYDVVEEEE